MINMYPLIASFRVSKPFCKQFYLTKNDGVVNNVPNTPTKPMLCKLKLSGLFSACHLPQLAIFFASFMEAS